MAPRNPSEKCTKNGNFSGANFFGLHIGNSSRFFIVFRMFCRNFSDISLILNNDDITVLLFGSYFQNTLLFFIRKRRNDGITQFSKLVLVVQYYSLIPLYSPVYSFTV